MLQMVARLDVGTVTTCAGSATTPPLYIYIIIYVYTLFLVILPTRRYARVVPQARRGNGNA